MTARFFYVPYRGVLFFGFLFRDPISTSFMLTWDAPTDHPDVSQVQLDFGKRGFFVSFARLRILPPSLERRGMDFASDKGSFFSRVAFGTLCRVTKGTLK